MKFFTIVCLMIFFGSFVLGQTRGSAPDLNNIPPDSPFITPPHAGAAVIAQGAPEAQAAPEVQAGPEAGDMPAPVPEKKAQVHEKKSHKKHASAVHAKSAKKGKKHAKAAAKSKKKKHASVKANAK